MGRRTRDQLSSTEVGNHDGGNDTDDVHKLQN